MSPLPTIAIDGRLRGYAAGIAQYVDQIVGSLARLDGPERFVLLEGRRARPGGHMRPRFTSRRVLTPPHHRLERQVLPFELLASRPALLHSVDHVTPAWGPWRSVLTVHDLAFQLFPETHTPASRAYYAATGRSARRADRVIAVSRNTAADVERVLGVPPERIRVVQEAAGAGYGPRPRALLAPLAQRLYFNPDQPYVLAVGTLEPRKNLPLLLQAMAVLARSMDVQLLVVGARGWLDRPIFETYEQLGLKGHVRFLGPLEEADLAVLYSHAGVFAFPSRYEGFGLVLLEAMASGAPVVSSNAGPLPEVAGDAALLLPPEDPACWAEALGRVLTDETLAASLRARGFARAREFSWDRAARETLAVYREVLGYNASR